MIGATIVFGKRIVTRCPLSTIVQARTIAICSSYHHQHCGLERWRGSIRQASSAVREGQNELIKQSSLLPTAEREHLNRNLLSLDSGPPDPHNNNNASKTKQSQPDVGTHAKSKDTRNAKRLMNQLTKKELVLLCRESSLQVSGRKAHLVDRLLGAAAAVREGQNELMKQSILPTKERGRLDRPTDPNSNNAAKTQNAKKLAKTNTSEPSPPEFKEMCFDSKMNYQLVLVQKLKQFGRLYDRYEPPSSQITDNMDLLMRLLPKKLSNKITNNKRIRKDLIEVVFDVGRLPFCWVGDKRYMLSKNPLSKSDLEASLKNLAFGQDNRAGIDGALHRVSCIRNRSGKIVGATLRVGRSITSNALLIADILLGSNASILFVGSPGSGKTSIIRDAARILAERCNVVIVDTSNEIAGAGDVPHDCVGMCRRLQVPSLNRQGDIMVEAVQNHTPSVIVIDEIGRHQEVVAALTCKERGVRMIASAHGDMAGLVRNRNLCDLVGGMEVITVGDQAARGGSKLRTERKRPPIFDVIVELEKGSPNTWRVVTDTRKAVDSILRSSVYDAQIRRRDTAGCSSIGVKSTVVEVGSI